MVGRPRSSVQVPIHAPGASRTFLSAYVSTTRPRLSLVGNLNGVQGLIGWAYGSSIEACYHQHFEISIHFSNGAIFDQLGIVASVPQYSRKSRCSPQRVGICVCMCKVSQNPSRICSGVQHGSKRVPRSLVDIESKMKIHRPFEQGVNSISDPFCLKLCLTPARIR